MSSTQENLSAKSETKTTWSEANSSHLRLVPFKISKSSACIPPEIQRLVEELVKKIEGVKRVIAVATSFPDIHWVDFQIELKADIQLSDESWDKIQDMIIDCEWKLIDDSTEEWYFRPQIVDRFYSFGDSKIADSDEKRYTKERRLKVWSINSPNFIVF
ncbi:hypothetical protein [Nostoc sp. TCL26-01]|uniref:hypothetical protein n=1 Tax=Nostoc sp. TCL26-01 TaxID=2576904 RepID=UPI0015B98A2D|nr:hypothetical protein [Nostoc sp. TCL26-01]QLE54783.1 hypothetical protein FD725_04210 [Nostoc sp. TCL26-01]